MDGTDATGQQLERVMPRERLIFGSGIERATGIAAVQPATARELVNVLPRRGKVRARTGMTLVNTLPSRSGEACAAVVLLLPIISQQETIAVGWYSVARTLHVYRLSGDVTAPVPPTYLGQWGTALEAGAVPKVIAAENFETVLLAHDEPQVGRRQPTFKYHVFDGTLAALQANLDGAGAADVYFRGVVMWNDYMAGWGFGSAAEPQHPEFLRLSLAGQPGTFDRGHYFIAGARGDAITSVREAGGRLIAFKPTRSYRVVGDRPLNFGILPLYDLTGCVSHRLSISIDGICYFRGPEAFYATEGADAPDTSRVLELEGPTPTELADLDSPINDAFVVYRPAPVRALEWIFGTDSYVLSIDEQEGAKWSYGERAISAACGALLYSGDTALDDSTGTAPDSYSIIDAVTPAGTTALLELTHVDAEEDEILEVWLSADGGDYVHWLPDFHVEGATQDVTITGLTPLVEYDVAVRHRRAAQYTPGYTDEDPAAWGDTTSSQETFTTVLDPPVLNSVVWARLSAGAHRMRVSFTPADAGVSHNVYRNGFLSGTAAPGTTFYDISVIGPEAEFSCEGPDHAYTVKALHGVSESVASNTITEWKGPKPPPSDVEFTVSFISEALVTWTVEIVGAQTEAWVDGVYENITAANATSILIPGYTPFDPITVRHARTAFGRVDFTDFETAVYVP